MHIAGEDLERRHQRPLPSANSVAGDPPNGPPASPPLREARARGERIGSSINVADAMLVSANHVPTT
jgi:hypothetical protein